MVTLKTVGINHGGQSQGACCGKCPINIQGDQRPLPNIQWGTNVKIDSVCRNMWKRGDHETYVFNKVLKME